MVAYIIANLDVIILRQKYPTIERSFKVPFGIVLPIVSTVSLVYMIYAIWPEDGTGMRQEVYLYGGLFLAACAIWAFIWVKFVMKKPLFQTIPMETLLKKAKESLESDK
jgi:amino acid transporter